MLNLLVGLLGIVITLLVVIGIHEFGHFITARLLGVKVLRFSIGFGKKLFSRHDKKGTEYVFAAIPLGGYIQMVDEREDKVSEADLPFAFNRQPVYKRALIIIAGPFFNLVLTFLLYWFLFIFGFNTIKPIIGEVIPNSISAQAKLAPQQEIIAIDNNKTPSWMAIIIHILSRTGDKNTLSLETQSLNSNKVNKYTLNLSTWHMDDLTPEPLESLGFRPYEPTIAPIVSEILPNSPAALSGLQSKDKIISVGKDKIKDWLQFITFVSAHPDTTIPITVERNNKKITFPLTIGSKRNVFFQKSGYIGVAPLFTWPKNIIKLNKYEPLSALFHSLHETLLLTKLNFIILGKMLTGKISLQSLGGPISIFESAGVALNAGLIPFFGFVAFLSISIAIINILPIPGLDGGQLLFQLIEGVTGKEIPLNIQLLFYRLGILLILLLLTQSLINDILRMFY